MRVVGRFADERQAGEDFTAWLDAFGGAEGDGRRPGGPGRLAVSRGTARLLHRLRRDRALRGRCRRGRVRGRMSAGELARKGNVVTLLDAPQHRGSDRRGAGGSRREVRERIGGRHRGVGSGALPPSDVPDRLHDRRGAHRYGRRAVEPSIEVVFIDTGYHFPRRWRRGEGPPPLRPQPADHDRPAGAGAVWKTDPANCCTSAKVAQLERALVGKLAWMSGLRRQEASTRAEAPIVGPGPPRPGQGQPDRQLDRPRCGGVHRRPRRPGQPSAEQGLYLDRLLALHPARGSWRALAGGPLVWARQDRVRAARVASTERRLHE